MRPKKKFSLLCAAVVFAALVFSACGEGGPTGPTDPPTGPPVPPPLGGSVRGMLTPNGGGIGLVTYTYMGPSVVDATVSWASLGTGRLVVFRYDRDLNTLACGARDGTGRCVGEYRTDEGGSPRLLREKIGEGTWKVLAVYYGDGTPNEANVPAEGQYSVTFEWP